MVRLVQMYQSNSHSVIEAVREVGSVPMAADAGSGGHVVALLKAGWPR